LEKLRHYVDSSISMISIKNKVTCKIYAAYDVVENDVIFG